MVVKSKLVHCFGDDLKEDRQLLVSQLNNLYKMRCAGESLAYKEAGFSKLNDLLMGIPGLALKGQGNKLQVHIIDAGTFEEFCQKAAESCGGEAPTFEQPQRLPDSLVKMVREVYRHAGCREIDAKSFRDFWSGAFPTEKLRCGDYGYRDLKGLLANIPILEKVGGRYDTKYVLRCELDMPAPGDTPARGGAPAPDRAPAPDSAPVIDSAPALDSTPVSGSVPAVAENSAPATDSDIEEDEQPSLGPSSLVSGLGQARGQGDPSSELDGLEAGLSSASVDHFTNPLTLPLAAPLSIGVPSSLDDVQMQPGLPVRVSMPWEYHSWNLLGDGASDSKAESGTVADSEADSVASASRRGSGQQPTIERSTTAPVSRIALARARLAKKAVEPVPEENRESSSRASSVSNSRSQSRGIDMRQSQGVRPAPLLTQSGILSAIASGDPDRDLDSPLSAPLQHERRRRSLIAAQSEDHDRKPTCKLTDMFKGMADPQPVQPGEGGASLSSIRSAKRRLYKSSSRCSRGDGEDDWTLTDPAPPRGEGGEELEVPKRKEPKRRLLKSSSRCSRHSDGDEDWTAAAMTPAPTELEVSRRSSKRRLLKSSSRCSRGDGDEDWTTTPAPSASKENPDAAAEAWKLKREERLKARQEGGFSRVKFSSAPSAISTETRDATKQQGKFDMGALYQADLRTDRNRLIVDFTSGRIQFSNNYCDGLFADLLPLAQRDILELLHPDDRHTFSNAMMYLAVGKFAVMERQEMCILTAEGPAQARIVGEQLVGAWWWLDFELISPDDESDLSDYSDHGSILTTFTAATDIAAEGRQPRRVRLRSHGDPEPKKRSALRS